MRKVINKEFHFYVYSNYLMVDKLSQMQL